MEKVSQCGQTLKHCIPPSPFFILCFLTVDSSVISPAPAPPSMPFLPAVLLSHHDGLFLSKTVKQNSSSLLKLVLVRVFCHSHENVTNTQRGCHKLFLFYSIVPICIFLNRVTHHTIFIFSAFFYVRYQTKGLTCKANTLQLSYSPVLMFW